MTLLAILTLFAVAGIAAVWSITDSVLIACRASLYPSRGEL